MQFLHTLFSHPGMRKAFLAVRVPVVLVALAVFAWFMKTDWLIPAVALSFFGEIIQVWCFASLVKNEELTARGPYVMVRNPMYLGRYFLILGFVMLLANVWVIIAYTVLYYFYMVNRVKREESRLKKLLGEPYTRYCASTWRFLPRLNRLFRSEVWFWDWRVMTSNNGHWNFLSAIASWAVVAAAFWLRPLI
ncbi:MAG: isoprenylcysteine carboxylmethyltransferase family protein [Gammaproteobacteria bacterium]|nr:isoprenylcysteine carboxylmethyltransferase family protein [Gammaproteobacteria bacterium]